jgi:hypothetical protein
METDLSDLSQGTIKKGKKRDKDGSRAAHGILLCEFRKLNRFENFFVITRNLSSTK